MTVDTLWGEICALAHGTNIPGELVGLERQGDRWQLVAETTPEADVVAALFLPILGPLPDDRPLVVAHLAQSLDGRIARPDGESHWITGEEDLDHTHRLRAFCGAVLVGAETVVHDDCRLTVRRCAGPQPLRVVLDPTGRVPLSRHVFQDAAAATLWVCAEGSTGCASRGVECVALPAVRGKFRAEDVLAALHDRGVRRVFVEGGGRTVSHFLHAGCLDRLHLAVAPLLMGDGRNTLGQALGTDLSSCPRPSVRVHNMGSDWLFDCDFSQAVE